MGSSTFAETEDGSQILRGSLLTVARPILWDSGSLGLIVRAPSKPQVVRCLAWLNSISANGATVTDNVILRLDSHDSVRISAWCSPNESVRKNENLELSIEQRCDRHWAKNIRVIKKPLYVL
jgi:hypothetical protein